MIWWEDFKVGERAEMGRHSFTEARASATRSGVGLVKHRWEAINQHGELVMTMEGWGMFRRRPAG